MATVTYAFTGTTYAAAVDGVIAGTDVTANGLSMALPSNLGYSTGSVLQLSNGGQNLDLNKYVTVTLSNTAGGAWNLTGITLKAARGGSTTPRGFQVRTSVDGYVNNLAGGGAIGTVRPNWTTFTIDTSTLGALSGPLTVRIYQYAPATTASIEMDDIVFTGAPVAGGTGYAADIAVAGGSGATVSGKAGVAAAVAVVTAAALTLGTAATAADPAQLTTGSSVASTQTVGNRAVVDTTSTSSTDGAGMVAAATNLNLYSTSDRPFTSGVMVWLTAALASQTAVIPPTIDVRLGVNIGLTSTTDTPTGTFAQATDTAAFTNQSTFTAVARSAATETVNLTSTAATPTSTVARAADGAGTTTTTTLTAPSGVRYGTTPQLTNTSTLTAATTGPAGIDINITIGPIKIGIGANLLNNNIQVTSEASVARVVN